MLCVIKLIYNIIGSITWIYFLKKKINNWTDFEDQFNTWRNIYFQPIIIGSSYLYNEKLCPDLFAKYRVQRPLYECHYYGQPRERQVEERKSDKRLIP